MECLSYLFSAEVDIDSVFGLEQDLFPMFDVQILQ